MQRNLHKLLLKTIKKLNPSRKPSRNSIHQENDQETQSIKKLNLSRNYRLQKLYVKKKEEEDMAGFDHHQQQVHSPKFCTNGCGFYGAAATLNLCSKCYRHYQTEEAPTAYLKLRVNNNVEDKHLNDPDDDATTVLVKQNPNRCSCCNKKVGLTGYKCRCGRSFCSVHRYPEEHCCMFDFKSVGREAIAGANPLVKADKLQKI